MKIANYLKKLDYFGHQFNFELNGNECHKSWQGAICSLFVFLCTILLVFSLGREIYERKNPNVNISEYIDENIEVGYLDFPFFIAFFNGQTTKNLDSYQSYFDTSITRYYFGDEKTIKIEKNLTLTSCRNMTFTKHNELIYDYMNTDSVKYLCLNSTENTKTKGKFPIKGSSYIRIIIDYCDPKLRSTCKATEEFKSQKTLISNYFINSFADSNIIDNPIKYYIDSYLTGFSFGVFKAHEFIFSKNYLISDNGWMLVNKKEFEYIQLMVKDKNFNLANNAEIGDENKRSVYSFSMKFQLTGIMIRRSYLKFDELIARIGGFSSLILLATQFVSNFYLKFLYIKYIRECIYNIRLNNNFNSSTRQMHNLSLAKLYDNIENFESKNTLKTKENNFINKSKDSKITKIDLEVKMFAKKKKSKINDLNTLSKESYQEETNLNFDFLNYILYCCFFSSNQLKTFIKKELLLISKYLDIRNVYHCLEFSLFEKEKND